MKAMTVEQLIKELRKHPNHTPVYLTVGDMAPLREIEKLTLHFFGEAVYLTMGDRVPDLHADPKHRI